MIVKLENLIAKVIDNRGRNPKHYFTKGHPIIDNYLIKNTLYPNINKVNRYIDKTTYKNFIRNYSKKNDVLITLVGNSSMGNVTMMPDNNSEIIQNTIGLRGNDEVNQFYLFYLLLSLHDKIISLNRGSAQRSIKKKDLFNIHVNIPNLSIQNSISNILYSIDKKIYNNKRIQSNLLKLTNYYFLKCFKDDDLYSGTNTLGSYIKFYDKRNKYLPKKIMKKIPGKYKYIGPTSTIGHINTYIFNGAYILIGSSGTVYDKNHHPMVQYINEPFWPNEDVHILRGNKITNEFLYMFLKHLNVSSIITGSVQKHINKRNLKSVPINVPNKKKLQFFQNKISPLFKQLNIFNRQNYLLKNLNKNLLLKFFN